MVTAGKVFKIANSTSLSDIASKLKGFKTEEEYQDGDYKFTLVTGYESDSSREHGCRRLLPRLHARISQRGKVVPLPKTIEAMFKFAQFKKQLHALVLSRSLKHVRVN